MPDSPDNSQGRPPVNPFTTQGMIRDPRLGQRGATDWRTLGTTPIPMLNRVLAFLTGSSVVAGLSGLFWDQIKRIFSSG